MIGKVVPLVFISAHKSDLDAFANQHRHESMIDDLISLGAQFRTITGHHSGGSEKSFIVYNNVSGMLDQIKHLAKEYKQDSILIRHHDNTCDLHFAEFNTNEYLGRFLEVDKHTATLSKSYSEIDGRYFVTER